MSLLVRTKMEVFLYNSTICRLCGEENDIGTQLYSCQENSQNLSELINTYLPIRVSNDGQLPQTICPGCTIQLEATVEFMNLIINGQKIIRELHQREKDYKKSMQNTAIEQEIITENIVYEVNTSDGVYQVEHPIALQVAGLEKPKRKRGRPPKKQKTPEEVATELANREIELKASTKKDREDEPSGKRKRKTPTRFREAVQGKELEKIFIEEGVIDEESDHEAKPEIDIEPQIPVSKEPEVIGHMENSGELVVVVKGKGRGRPKGRMRPMRSECVICGMQFSCAGRYMSHVAAHGPVAYRCGCGAAFRAKLRFDAHQRAAAHAGLTVLPAGAAAGLLLQDEDIKDQPADNQGADPASASTNDAPVTSSTNSLPDLNPEPSADADDAQAAVMKPEDEINHSPIPIEIPSSPSNSGVKISDASSDVVVMEETNEDQPAEGSPVKGRLKCNHCDKTFSTKQSKSLHIKATHQGARPYACKECGAVFAYPRSLALHAVSHRRRHAAAKGFACDLCGKVLNHPSSVVYHKEAVHAGQRYVCGKCGKLFKHKQLLQRHQLVHSALRPYTCKTCNASFKTKANLLNHQLLHSGVKKFSCEICKHRFAHKTSLTLHMRWHTGQKPYSCETCGKSFSQKGNLSEHERIHTGEKPFQCAACPRRFTTSSQHRLHARRHQPHPHPPHQPHPHPPHQPAHNPPRSGSRAAGRGAGAGAAAGAGAGGAVHVCGWCGRELGSRWALLKHARLHTGERPFRCTHCPRAFADASNLNKHKKQVHKQISLLATSNQPAAAASPAAASPAAPQLAAVQVTGEDELEERIIYVTYDVDEPNSPAFHILDPEQAASLDESKVLTTCELYSGPSLLVPQPELEHLELEHEQLVLDAQEHMPVTDEQGNPLHFTMQDGTRLAITSADGKSLQVITQDGQTIPVEINGYAEEEEVENPDMIVHQLNLQKSVEANVAAPVTHYFTIV